MAVDLCSETFDASPRISFSLDLRISGIIPVEPAPSLFGGSNQSFDFDSCGFDRSGWSSADELFSDGKMIPLLHIKKNVQEEEIFTSSAPLPTKADHQRHGGDRETEGGANYDNKNKSFWRFGRSSSWNGGGYGRMGLCPLPLLSRSNSTGSTARPRGSEHPSPKPWFHPHESNPGSNGWYQKPPLGRGGRNTVRVDPVLATGNMFGLYSVFGRDKRKKRNK